jgi:hypothetical protein
MRHREEEKINEAGVTSACILGNSHSKRFVVQKKLRIWFTNLLLKYNHKYVSSIMHTKKYLCKICWTCFRNE